MATNGVLEAGLTSSVHRNPSTRTPVKGKNDESDIHEPRHGKCVHHLRHIQRGERRGGIRKRIRIRGKVRSKVERVRRVQLPPVSHSGQNVIHLKTRRRILISLSPWTLPGKKREKKRATGHVPAVELGRAENEDPLIRRRVALHDLIRDKRGDGSGVEHGQQPDSLRDGRGVCGGGIFTRTMQRVALKKEKGK